MVYDFHAHTFLSDGDLSPAEMIRRAVVRGYRAIALTDHVGAGTLEATLAAIVRECELVREHWEILALPGVELTHVPPATINRLAARARTLGAKVVLVHGETLVEPVEAGTNEAALSSPHVDILSHPGLLSEQLFDLAAGSGKYLEVSARMGHSLSNGFVVQGALRSGEKLIVNSDAHGPGDLMDVEFVRMVALGAGIPNTMLDEVLTGNPSAL